MKFVIKNSTVAKEDKPIEIDLVETMGGGVAVTVNGHGIIAFGLDGTLSRYKWAHCIVDKIDELNKLGFQLDSEGRVKFYGE